MCVMPVLKGSWRQRWTRQPVLKGSWRRPGSLVASSEGELEEQALVGGQF